jgi:hypothetical protein
MISIELRAWLKEYKTDILGYIYPSLSYQSKIAVFICKKQIFKYPKGIGVTGKYLLVLKWFGSVTKIARSNTPV